MSNNEKLFIADQCVGELEWGPDGDFPWAKGRFIATSVFEQFLPYVESKKSSSGLLKHSLNFDLLIEAGFQWADFRLIDENDVAYIYALDYYDDGTAYWRFSETPLDED